MASEDRYRPQGEEEWISTGWVGYMGFDGDTRVGMDVTGWPDKPAVLAYVTSDCLVVTGSTAIPTGALRWIVG